MQILCLITGPVSLVIDNQVNSHFAFIALAIIFCCFLSMALIFIPKIMEIINHQQNMGIVFFKYYELNFKIKILNLNSRFGTEWHIS